LSATVGSRRSAWLACVSSISEVSSVALRSAFARLHSVRTAAGALAAAATAFTLAVDASPAEAVAAPAPYIVALGDSVPAGSQCDCAPFVKLYARMVATHVHRAVPVADDAHGSYTTPDVLTQLRTASVQQHVRRASTVVIMIGANDFNGAFGRVLDGAGSEQAEFAPVARRVEVNVAAIVRQVERVHGTPVHVVVLDYWNVMKDGRVGRAVYGASGLRVADSATAYCTQALRLAAVQTGAQFVSTVPVFKGPRGTGDPTGLLAADGDHPNAAGHYAIAKALYRLRPGG
jgi:lysophospholipase L1-like esterase